MTNLLNALHFLTVFRVPGINQDNLHELGKSLPYFPLVGLIIGIILAGFCYILNLILPASVNAVMLLTALVIITGAHHMDGVADICDALTVGKTREQRLAIMADTRIGTFGIAGVCMLILIKYTAIMQVIHYSFAGIILFPMLSRWALTCSIVAFPSAKTTGMGYAVKSTSSRTCFIWATLWPLLAIILFYGILKGLLIMAGLLILIGLLGLFFTRLFGGMTGDTYGALLETGDVMALLLLVLMDYNKWIIYDWQLISLPQIM